MIVKVATETYLALCRDAAVGALQKQPNPDVACLWRTEMKDGDIAVGNVFFREAVALSGASYDRDGRFGG